MAGRAGEEGGERGRGVGDGVGRELGEPLRACGAGAAGARRSRKLPPPMVRWALVSRMTKRSPASGRDRAVEDELDEAALAGRDRRGRRGGRRAPVTSAVPWCRWTGSHWATGRGSPGEHAELGVDPVGRRVQPGVDDHVAAGDGVPGDALAGEVERAAVAGAAALGGSVLGVQAADAHRRGRSG